MSLLVTGSNTLGRLHPSVGVRNITVLDTTHFSKESEESCTDCLARLFCADLVCHASTLNAFDRCDHSCCSTGGNLLEAILGDVGEGNDVVFNLPAKALGQLDQGLLGDRVEDGGRLGRNKDGFVIALGGWISEGNKVGGAELVDVGMCL